ncbi:hypothetical protein EW146_g5105 [Bondarzewia mesenterica]|uniref:DNA polymerase alpha subunit B n=1 Tax=Bondarzewia mesenterica TaxID=1095465 RepID=A0A4S4LSJ0_9AGAM|nr:hypothetical protein EW146_g5105 [Bondarzewia mesenterica]
MQPASNITNLTEELASAFSTTPGSDDAFLQQCAGLCKTFNISPIDLYYKWESLVISNSAAGARIINKDTVHAIRSLLQSELTKAAKASSKRPDLNRAVRGRGAGILGLAPRRNAGFPEIGLVKPALGDRFASSSDNRRAGPSKVSFQYQDDEVSKGKHSYRYMYEKISERSEVLDDRIDDFGELVKEHYGISELGDPSASTDDEIFIVGRITLDSESSSSGAVKLNEASLCLESSRMMGSGVRVPLKFGPHVKVRSGLKGMSGFGLFPGAIVALKGKNGGGGWFLASEILTLPPLKPSHANPSVLKPDSRDTSFSMVIASGPYTPDADLRYQPWLTFLQSIKSQKPTLVLLIGPFIDSNHPQLKSGDIDETPVDMFFTRFTENLRDFLDVSPDSLVLLIPSVRDIISQHVVYPQSELGAEFSKDPRILLLPNPCQFSVNGINFAVSSVDVLFHLRKEELVKRVEEVDTIATGSEDNGTDTMANTCRHLLQQRSFYPIFPVPVDLSHEVNLDVSHSKSLDLCPDDSAGYAPDVLIVPSRLKHFSKVVDDTVAINPSFLTKGVSATLKFDGHGAGPTKSRITVNVGRAAE